MSKNFRVVFSGDIADGYTIDQVKAKLAVLLKRNKRGIDSLFAGKPLVIKKNIDLQTSEKIQQAFLSIGAVCTIVAGEDMKELEVKQDEEETLVVYETSPSDPPPQNDTQPLQKKEKRERKEILKRRIAEKKQQTKEFLDKAKERSTQIWSEGSESIKSDMEVGGMVMVTKNKYFIIWASTLLLLFCLLIAGLTYEKKAMPLTSSNLNNLLNHIEFIEKAFTIEELETMTKNPKDFLDYLLVDPIDKMGYEFEPTIEDISKEFLDDDLSKEELAKVKAYLEIAAHERFKLQTHGFISENVKIDLDAVSKKMKK